MNYPEGVILNINKPYGWTSTDVVRKLKSRLRAMGFPKIKIGHAGTLDPLATGVLLVCIGKSTKKVTELQEQTKEYIFTVELGATTVSFDLEHPVDQRYPSEHITLDMVTEYVKSLPGDIEQVPPAYSAKRIGGKRAYELMRDGKPVELKTCPITIYEAELLDYTAPHAKIRVKCSKGTYIRSIARDMGLDLKSGGYLTELVRTQNGGYNIENGLNLDNIDKFMPLNETNSPHTT